MNWRLVSIVAVVMSVAGCGGIVTPVAPTPPASVVWPDGNWSGSISDPISGDGTMQLSLSDQAPNKTGSWSVTFKNGDRFSGPGVAGLFALGSYGIILYVQNPPPPCATESGPGGSPPLSFMLINVVVTTSQLTAVTGRLSCSGPGITFGTVNLSKQ